MELDSRPLLLSPVLPRLPGTGRTPAAEEEPPLQASDFAPRPPPLECKPPPPEVQRRLAGGEGLLVALAAYSKHSQLAWCQQRAQQEQQRMEQDQQAAAAPPPPQQAERPARALGPAALPAALAAGAGEEGEGSDAEGGAPSEPLPRPCSRASAAPAQDAATTEAAADEEAGQEDNELAAMLEAELGGGDEEMLDAAEGQPLAPPPPPPPRAADPESAAAAAEPAEPPAQQQTASAPARARAPRRQQARPQAAAGAQPASVTPAAPPAAVEARPAAAAKAPAAAAPTAAAQPVAEAAALARHASIEAAARAATAAAAAAAVAAAAADEPLSEAEEQEGAEGEKGGEGRQGRKRALSAQEAATEAALQKIGQDSWEALCQQLQQRAEQAERQQEAGGRGGRGRGRKGGRKGGRRGGRGAAQQAVRLTDVLNPNSAVYHAEFVAAYHEAKEELAKTDAKRQRLEALKEHSKLVRRWSDLSAKEHEWFLRHQGQALVGSEAQRMALLQGRVAAEQQRYWQDVQQRAAGGAAAQRYQHATARQLAQLEDDAAQRRQRVTQQLPRCFHLRAVLPVPTAPAAPAADGRPAQPPTPQLRHVAMLRREGQAPLFEVPAGGTKLHGDRLYLPCSVPAGAAGSAAAAPAQVYRKQAVAPLAEDPLLPELALQALQAKKGTDQQQQQGQEQQGQEQQGQERDMQQEPPATAGSEQQQQQGQPLFCLAASAFSDIVGTPMLQRRPAWEIPITIQPLPAPVGEQAGEAAVDGRASGSVMVCIDKPLQQRVLTMRAKQQRLQKYAVLSMAAHSKRPQGQAQQHRGAAGEAEGEAEKGETPARHSTRSTRGAAAAGAAEAGRASGETKAAGAAGAAPAGLPPREAAYDCWQLGGTRLLLRSHGRMMLQPAAVSANGGDMQAGGEGAGQQAEQGGQQAGQHEGQQGGQQAQDAGEEGEKDGGQEEAQEQAKQQQQAQQEQQPQHVLLALKTEYLPEEEREEFTVDELCCWWLRLSVCPTADALLAAHVHVPHSKLLSCQALTAADLERHCSGAGKDDGGEAASRHMRRLAGAGLALLQQLLGALGALPPGRYLLAHAPGEPTCCLFKALSPEAAAAVEGEPPPLPCSATLAQPGTMYDLHAAHQRSGATDTETPCFVPPRWRPFHPEIAQIPYTFPPSGLGLGQLGKQQRYKQRQRKVLPHAWKVLGEGGDFDQVQHVAQISRDDYLEGLEEGLP